MKRKTLEMTNGFHITSATVRAQVIRENKYYVTNRQARDLRNKLCGVSGCKCGGNFGERGPGLFAVPDDTNGGWIIEIA